MYSVFLKPKAKKAFSSLPNDYAEKVKKAFEILQYEPIPSKELDVQKIKGSDKDYRIRIGAYRFLYHIFEKEKAVVVLKIERRSETTYN